MVFNECFIVFHWFYKQNQSFTTLVCFVFLFYCGFTSFDHGDLSFLKEIHAFVYDYLSCPVEVVVFSMVLQAFIMEILVSLRNTCFC